MNPINIKLAVLWICTMLTYLLGDVIRIFAGDFKAGFINETKMTNIMTLTIALLMVIPIVMILLSVTLPQNINKWVNIIVAVFFIVFNIAGLSGYKPYDQFLLIISIIFNVITIYYAWNWTD